MTCYQSLVQQCNHLSRSVTWHNTVRFHTQNSCHLGNSKNMEVLHQLNFLAHFWSRSCWVVKQVPLKNGTLICTVIQITNELGISVKKTDFQLFCIIWKLKGLFFSTWTVPCYCHSFCLSRITILKRKLIYSSLNFFFLFFKKTWKNLYLR